jgi:tetratricopeptide (TPR) repeat protein
MTIRELIESAAADHAAGRLPEAERNYREALRQAPDHPIALHGLGRIAEQMGFRGDAIQLLRRAAERAPEVADIHDALGVSLFNAGESAAAAQAFAKAVTLRPNEATFRLRLGAALQLLNRTDEALVEYDEAL